MTPNDIVQKLWNLCDVLRDDGINCSDYVTELVLLLFIKMEHENQASGVLAAHRLPDYARWQTLSVVSGLTPLEHTRIKRRKHLPDGHFLLRMTETWTR